MSIEYFHFSASKGNLPIELAALAARFIVKLLSGIAELNWADHWTFRESFWAIALGLGLALGIIVLLRKTNA